jgi:hypothetical protein
VDRFVSYKDVNSVDAHFLSNHEGLLDCSALYDTPDVDLQVSLLRFCQSSVYVPIRWKFVCDPRYPWMAHEIRDAIR